MQVPSGDLKFYELKEGCLVKLGGKWLRVMDDRKKKHLGAGYNWSPESSRIESMRWRLRHEVIKATSWLKASTSGGAGKADYTFSTRYEEESKRQAEEMAGFKDMIRGLVIAFCSLTTAALGGLIGGLVCCYRRKRGRETNRRPRMLALEDLGASSHSLADNSDYDLR